MLPPELLVSPDFSHRRLIIQELKVKTGKAAILHFLDEQGVEPFLVVADGVVFARNPFSPGEMLDMQVFIQAFDEREDALA